MRKYRIYRVDSRNIAIQEMRGVKLPRWEIISYHGNSPSSLVSGLFDLIMTQHIPADTNLLKQLENIELAIVSSIEEIRKIVNDL